jgi:Uma2 family endonuclease
MTGVLLDLTSDRSPRPEIIYPSSDGAPLAETFDHLYVIMTTVAMLMNYLRGQQATVLADQYLYYAQGFPRLRVAPDVMVIFNVQPGGRDNYKIWEEGQVPAVIFEVTSPSTRLQDEGDKRNLYESLGVTEYWQFDPRGEWIPEKLRGYRLQGDTNQTYLPITNGQCLPLQLQLTVEDKVIAFHRLDNGEKLLPPTDLDLALAKEIQRSKELESQLAMYQQRFGKLPNEDLE